MLPIVTHRRKGLVVNCFELFLIVIIMKIIYL